jgi:hypothetical protein
VCVCGCCSKRRKDNATQGVPSALTRRISKTHAVLRCRTMLGADPSDASCCWPVNVNVMEQRLCGVGGDGAQVGFLPSVSRSSGGDLGCGHVMGAPVWVALPHPRPCLCQVNFTWVEKTSPCVFPVWHFRIMGRIFKIGDFGKNRSCSPHRAEHRDVTRVCVVGACPFLGVCSRHV